MENLFTSAKSKAFKPHSKKMCEFCGKDFVPDPRNLKRGWGKACTKSCSASLKSHVAISDVKGIKYTIVFSTTSQVEDLKALGVELKESLRELYRYNHLILDLGNLSLYGMNFRNYTTKITPLAAKKWLEAHPTKVISKKFGL